MPVALKTGAAVAPAGKAPAPAAAKARAAERVTAVPGVVVAAPVVSNANRASKLTLRQYSRAKRKKNTARARGYTKCQQYLAFLSINYFLYHILFEREAEQVCQNPGNRDRRHPRRGRRSIPPSWRRSLKQSTTRRPRKRQAWLPAVWKPCACWPGSFRSFSSHCSSPLSPFCSLCSFLPYTGTRRRPNSWQWA